jgi:hypothetical protein
VWRAPPSATRQPATNATAMTVIYKNWFGCAVIGTLSVILLLLLVGSFDWLGDPTWVTAVATSVLSLAALMALASLWDAKRTRHATIVTDLSRRWDEPAATDARQRSGDYEPAALVDLVDRVYRPADAATTEEREKDVEELFRLGRWLNVLETVGVLYTEKSLSRRVIFKLWGGQIAAAWERWEAAITLMRTTERRPGIYGNFEKLAKKMRHMLAKELRKTRTG